MNRNDIFRKTEEICRDVFEDESLQVTEESTAEDVEGWDSLTHIQLIVAIEKHFKIKFTSKEILSWKNVRELVDCLAAKLA